MGAAWQSVGRAFEPAIFWHEGGGPGGAVQNNLLMGAGGGLHVEPAQPGSDT
jgi:hypothetical protein